jgi:hypothetical protein
METFYLTTYTSFCPWIFLLQNTIYYSLRAASKQTEFFLLFYYLKCIITFTASINLSTTDSYLIISVVMYFITLKNKFQGYWICLQIMKRVFNENHNNCGQFQIMLTLALLCTISLINQGLILFFVTVYMTLVIPVTMVCMNLPF